MGTCCTFKGYKPKGEENYIFSNSASNASIFEQIEKVIKPDVENKKLKEKVKNNINEQQPNNEVAEIPPVFNKKAFGKQTSSAEQAFQSTSQQIKQNKKVTDNNLMSNEIQSKQTGGYVITFNDLSLNQSDQGGQQQKQLQQQKNLEQQQSQSQKQQQQQQPQQQKEQQLLLLQQQQQQSPQNIDINQEKQNIKQNHQNQEINIDNIELKQDIIDNKKLITNQLGDSPVNGQNGVSGSNKGSKELVSTNSNKIIADQNPQELQQKKNDSQIIADDKNINQYQNQNQSRKKSFNQSKQNMSEIYNMQVKVGPEVFVHLKQGSIFDEYIKKQVLGEGAYGVVCLVEHKKTNIIRAMKTLKKANLVKEEEKQLFQEMNILKNLDHPNIVKLYELFQDDLNYYLITEYCSGGELFERIKKMSDFSEKTAAKYIKQLLGAVQYCHEKNIVHRDLKPENLLFDKPGAEGILKVIDFGTSRKFGQQNMTKRLGTPYYIAPEVLSQNYNEKCDVWSCGIILYILLCGYPPFTGKNEKEILKNVKSAKLQFDPEEWSKISNDAKSLIKKMLQPDPNLRISAKEACNDKWIQQNVRSIPLDTKFLNNINNFDAKNKLKTAILTFITTQVCQSQEKEELQKAFQSIDTDGDGVLSREELIEGYTKFYNGDRQLATQQAEQMLVDIDRKIDYTEFIVAAMNKDEVYFKQKIETAFKMFDADGNGYIDQKELDDIMGDINEEKWQTILKAYDKNNDGKIQLDEFINIIEQNIVDFDQSNNDMEDPNDDQ